MSNITERAALARQRKKEEEERRRVEAERLAEERRIEAERQAEQKRIEAEQRKIEEEKRKRLEVEKLKNGIRVRPAFDLVESELTGQYDEVDKLAKKVPNEPVTDLQLRVLNNLIRKAKYLLSGDTIIGEVEIFVAAGNNPEYREVLTVLRQIRQGLERYKVRNSFIFGPSFAAGIEKYGLSDEDPGDFFADMGRVKDGVTE